MKPTPVQEFTQPECKECARFSILRAPCRQEACIFRQHQVHPAQRLDQRAFGSGTRYLFPGG